MAGSNALYPDDPEINDECPPTADLWSDVDEWRIEAAGAMTGEYDWEHGDRPFNGDMLHCRGERGRQDARGRQGLRGKGWRRVEFSVQRVNGTCCSSKLARAQV